MTFGPEQLELLKRKAEEDFKLDMAAIERLQRRLATVSLAAAPPAASPARIEAMPEPPAPQPEPVIVDTLPAPAQPDDLGSSLRTMFRAAR